MNKDTEKAFSWIIKILEENNIPYRISGGFAARAHGVQRDLADIDIEIPEDFLKIIENKAGKYIMRPLELFVDENWKIKLLTIIYHGQEIDICSSKSQIFNQQTKKWDSSFVDLEDNIKIKIYGKLVNIEPVDSLISYKTKLDREVDREDILQLKKIYNFN
jgi:hypothetical protein